VWSHPSQGSKLWVFFSPTYLPLYGKYVDFWKYLSRTGEIHYNVSSECSDWTIHHTIVWDFLGKCVSDTSKKVWWWPCTCAVQLPDMAVYANMAVRMRSMLMYWSRKLFLDSVTVLKGFSTVHRCIPEHSWDPCGRPFDPMGAYRTFFSKKDIRVQEEKQHNPR
jgi:hypothetical protein